MKRTLKDRAFNSYDAFDRVRVVNKASPENNTNQNGITPIEGGTTTAIDIQNFSTVAFVVSLVSGTTVFNIQAEASLDGVNFVPLEETQITINDSNPIDDIIIGGGPNPWSYARLKFVTITNPGSNLDIQVGGK